MIYSRSPPGGTDSPLTFIILWEINTLETSFSLSPHLSLGLWPIRKNTFLLRRDGRVLGLLIRVFYFNGSAFLVLGPPATPESWVMAGSGITSCSAQSLYHVAFLGSCFCVGLTASDFPICRASSIPIGALLLCQIPSGNSN